MLVLVNNAPIAYSGATPCVVAYGTLFPSGSFMLYPACHKSRSF